MATYTENYNLKKPTYAESANVMVINENMDKVDEIMHSTQVSLADAYDLNNTYNTGDKVMYEKLMYKCLEDGVTGAWDSEKWERTTAVEGSGGADLDIYGEASGTAEASFSDGAEASLVECEIGIVPSQDLHGYSKPWAGGAGKNKLPITATSQTVQGVTFTINSNGTISLSGTATGRADFVLSTFNAYGGNYTISGAPQNGSAKWNLRIDLTSSGETNQCYDDGTNTSSPTMNTSQGTQIKAIIRVCQGINTNGLIFKPMLEQGESATTFEPYSNICPISGHSTVTVTVASTSGGSGEDYTVSLGSTYYGGNLDVTTGELEVTWGNIASYAGETLPGEWLSSLDEYTALGTPTTGAQVVYELATPQTYTLTPTQVLTLLGQNYVSHDGGGTISLVYVKGDAPIKPNPTGADIPLKGIEIDGEKFKIPSGANYITDVLLDETNGVTVGVTYGFLNNHTLDEYDAIEIIVATIENASGGLGYDHWFMTVRSLLDFPIINYGAYGQRWFYATFTNNSFTQNNSSGDQYPYIYRIYGIKY